ncbi:MAG: BatA domain-containing protein [Ignavibacteria bacterium]|nr:BatA domain-containing protein [Ignavibacteria bacterium]
MTFLNPLFLFGLAAAALPLLIHLLNLRKLKVIDFSSLQFLKELQRTRIRRVKVKQILLLIIRTLLVIFIVLAFARPALQGNMAGFAGSAARSAMVILLDDSPSMTLRTQQGLLFDRAKETVAAILDLAEPGDRVYFITLSEAHQGSPVPSAGSPREIAGILPDLEPSHRTIPVDEAMQFISMLLDDIEEINKEVFLVSDHQRTQFFRTDHDSAKIAGHSAGIFCISPSGAAGVGNYGITGLTTTAQVVTRGRPLTYTAMLSNSSDSPVQNLLLSVYLDGERSAQRSVLLPPLSGTSHQFAVTPRKSGVLAGTVEIEEDPLDLDNRRYFTLAIPPTIRVGLVGSSEANRFLDLALSAASGAGFSGLFSVESLDESRIGSLNLAAYDVLILSGVTDLTTEEGERIHRFVRGGGGLAFFPHPSTNLTSVNAALFRTLGIPAIEGISGGADGSATGSLSFGDVDMVHPIFSGLFEERIGNRTEATFESPRILRSLRLSAGPGGNPLIRLSDGSPFLVDYGVGSGRVLVFAVDAALAWSDLPVKGVFAPLVHRSVVFLETGREDQDAFVAGMPASIGIRTPAAPEASYVIQTPDGMAERVVPSLNPLTGMTVFQLPSTRRAGIYRLFREDGGADPISAVAVNIDPGESKLEPMTGEELRTYFRTKGFEEERISILTSGDELGRIVQESRYGTELWKTMLTVAILLALLEMAVARVRRPGETGEVTS